MDKPAYQRILLKLSGEALLGNEDYGIDPVIIGRIANEVLEVRKSGIGVAIVIGGGNIFRGAGLADFPWPGVLMRPWRAGKGLP